MEGVSENNFIWYRINKKKILIILINSADNSNIKKIFQK